MTFSKYEIDFQLSLLGKQEYFFKEGFFTQNLLSFKKENARRIFILYYSLFYNLLIICRKKFGARDIDIKKSKKSISNRIATISFTIDTIILQCLLKKNFQKGLSFKIYSHVFLKHSFNFLKIVLESSQSQFSLNQFTQHGRLTKRLSENALNESFIDSVFKEKILRFFLENNISFKALRLKSF